MCKLDWMLLEVTCNMRFGKWVFLTPEAVPSLLLQVLWDPLKASLFLSHISEAIYHFKEAVMNRCEVLVRLYNQRL